MKKTACNLLWIALIASFAACSEKSSHQDTDFSGLSNPYNETIDSADILTNKVLTAAEQKALKPEDVLTILKQGNVDFTEDRLTIRNTSQRIRAAAASQFPKAVILSCLDSRVPVEDVFHRGIGDIFVARVAGNIANEDIIGSMEYGCKVSGAKLIMVLGHENCGAIKSAIDNVQLGNISALLAKIRPAVKRINGAGNITRKNKAFVHAVCLENVHQTIALIRKNSSIIAAMEKEGELKLVGGIYNMETGKVDFLNK